MSTIILIHGAWHGSWCWYKVVPILENKGHKVIAIDLPRYGNKIPQTTDIFLDTYVNCVGEILSKQTSPVILVGHSMGGIVVSQLAEYYPEKISLSVYLAAFLLTDGQSLLSAASVDRDSLIPPNLEIDQIDRVAKINPKAIANIFYHDCLPEDIKLAQSLLLPQPLTPMNTPIKITNSNFGKVGRIYIETLQDRAMSPSLQKQMYLATPCQKIISLNSGHSPFFSIPQELAQIFDLDTQILFDNIC